MAGDFCLSIQEWRVEDGKWTWRLGIRHLFICIVRYGGEMCFESLYRFRFVRLYCIIGNAKCKYKKFPFHKTICRTEPSNR